MRKHILKSVIGLLLLTIQMVSAQSGIRVVVVNEFQNIRVAPALGAEVITTVDAGFVFENIDARSGDNQWLRIQHECNEGWINVAPLVVLQGDINSLPTADPRSVPYGGFEAPRAGYTTQQGPVSASATDGLRVRGGPSRAYPTLTNINFNQAFTISGRTACNNWYQVVFEGNLGWVSSTFVRIINGDVMATPVNGVVAESAPPSGESRDSYIATLKLLRDRILLAQPSLNAIRASWTDAALQGRAVCQAYPARPSDISVPVPMLAAYFVPLDSLVRDFNDAMFNTRQVIDLFIEVCNQPGTANPVGQATVQGALGIVNLAEQQYGALLQRLTELIPDEEVGPNECLLIYNNKSEILPRINIGTIYLDEFNRRTYARGYCFDAIETQTLRLQTLPIPESDLEIFIAISPLDDPANFLLVSQGTSGQKQSAGPLVIPRTTTYLLIIADLGSEGRAPIGEFAFHLADLTFFGLAGSSVPELEWDSINQAVYLRDVLFSTPVPGGDFFPPPGTGGGTGGGETPPNVCPSLSFTCNDFFTCEEAQACFDAGNFLLDDEDNVLNGVPCEQSVCFGQGSGTQVTCPSLTATCDQLTAEQVSVCYAQGNLQLDTDGDGIACEGTHNIPVGGQ
jgi:uncharacterized protein YgiM (DUF1202 family)